MYPTALHRALPQGPQPHARGAHPAWEGAHAPEIRPLPPWLWGKGGGWGPFQQSSAASRTFGAGRSPGGGASPHPPGSRTFCEAGRRVVENVTVINVIPAPPPGTAPAQPPGRAVTAHARCVSPPALTVSNAGRVGGQDPTSSHAPPSSARSAPARRRGRSWRLRHWPPGRLRHLPPPRPEPRPPRLSVKVPDGSGRRRRRGYIRRSAARGAQCRGWSRRAGSALLSSKVVDSSSGNRRQGERLLSPLPRGHCSLARHRRSGATGHGAGGGIGVWPCGAGRQGGLRGAAGLESAGSLEGGALFPPRLKGSSCAGPAPAPLSPGAGPPPGPCAEGPPRCAQPDTVL